MTYEAAKAKLDATYRMRDRLDLERRQLRKQRTDEARWIAARMTEQIADLDRSLADYRYAVTATENAPASPIAVSGYRPSMRYAR